MNIMRRTWATFCEHRKSFIMMNAVFYALFALSMIGAMLVPQWKATALSLYDIHNIKHPLLDYTYAGYASGDMAQAAAGTFTVNFIVALLAIVPSIIVPYSGIPYVYVRGFLWGAMFAPFGWERVILVPHMPTVLVEGFAYVIAAFAAYIFSVRVTQRDRSAPETYVSSVRAGMSAMAPFFAIAVAILVFAALYEAYEVIHLVPKFAAGVSPKG